MKKWAMRLALSLALLVAGWVIYCGQQWSQRRLLPESMDLTALSGGVLYGDLIHYARLGYHRLGAPGDRATSSWIANRLQALRYETRVQEYQLRQYVLEEAALELAGESVELFHQWWPPEEAAAIDLVARLALPDDVAELGGRIAVITEPRRFESSGFARLPAAILQQVDALDTKGAAAVILVARSAAPRAFNVGQKQPVFPIPLLVAGASDRQRLVDAAAQGAQASLRVRGRYQDVRSGNVFGYWKRGTGKTIVISTPLTGWFQCAGERGPGVALWLGLAAWVSRNEVDASFLFLAPTGHEIEHHGLDLWLEEFAPAPEATRVWIHLGANIAVREGRIEAGRFVETEDRSPGLFAFSPDLTHLYHRYFLPEGRFPLPTTLGAPGSLQAVVQRGYPSHMMLVGTHTLFHTAQDGVESSEPKLLEPVAHDLVRAILDLIES
jgi:hypothetical protein